MVCAKSCDDMHIGFGVGRLAKHTKGTYKREAPWMRCHLSRSHEAAVQIYSPESALIFLQPKRMVPVLGHEPTRRLTGDRPNKVSAVLVSTNADFGGVTL